MNSAFLTRKRVSLAATFVLLSGISGVELLAQEGIESFRLKLEIRGAGLEEPAVLAFPSVSKSNSNTTFPCPGLGLGIGSFSVFESEDRSFLELKIQNPERTFTRKDGSQEMMTLLNVTAPFEWGKSTTVITSDAVSIAFEAAEIDLPQPNKPDSKSTPSILELTPEQIAELEIDIRLNKEPHFDRLSIRGEIYNPTAFTINGMLVRVKYPREDGKEAIDRVYKTSVQVGPLADNAFQQKTLLPLAAKDAKVEFEIEKVFLKK